MRCFKLGLVSLFGVSVAVASCGESDRQSTKQSTPAGGSAGQPGEASGGSEELPAPVPCGTETCEALRLAGGDAVAPCCVDPSEGLCGADVSVLMPTMGCQSLSQPGELDPSCPPSPGGTVGGFPVPPFPGCCREATGQCGFMVSDLGGLLPFAAGCVDATPFLDGGTPAACGGGGTGGVGGAGSAGAAGSSGASSGGAGDDPGGAAGASGAAGAPGAAGSPGGAGGAEPSMAP